MFFQEFRIQRRINRNCSYRKWIQVLIYQVVSPRSNQNLSDENIQSALRTQAQFIQPPVIIKHLFYTTHSTLIHYNVFIAKNEILTHIIWFRYTQPYSMRMQYVILRKNLLPSHLIKSMLDTSCGIPFIFFACETTIVSLPGTGHGWKADHEAHRWPVNSMKTTCSGIAEIPFHESRLTTQLTQLPPM